MAPQNKYNIWQTPENLTRIRGWARDGLTREEIALKMDISYVCLKRWELRFPDTIGDALKEGKDYADRRVEESLFRRACGYDYEETTSEKKVLPDGRIVITKQITITKHVMPDTAAGIFWLKNRKPQEWQERRIVDNVAALEKLDAVLSKIEGVDDPILAGGKSNDRESEPKSS